MAPQSAYGGDVLNKKLLNSAVHCNWEILPVGLAFFISVGN